MPDTPTPLDPSHGVTLSFAGTTGLIKNVKDLDLSSLANAEDVSDLSLAEGSIRNYEGAPLLGGEELKIDADYASGTTWPKVNDEGSLTTSLGTITGYAVCTQATVVRQTGELITLSLSFKIGDNPD